MNLLTRLFGHSDTTSAMLCPHCERAMDAEHDADACARKSMSRRFFFGVLGGAAVAIALPKPPLGLAFHRDAYKFVFTLPMDTFGERYITPAAKALADQIDQDVLGYNLAGLRPPIRYRGFRAARVSS